MRLARRSRIPNSGSRGRGTAKSSFAYARTSKPTRASTGSSSCAKVAPGESSSCRRSLGEDAIRGAGSKHAILGVLASDEPKDIAILAAEGGAFPALALGTSTGVRPGDEVVVIGSPKGLSGTLRVWPAFAVQPLPLSQGAPPPPGAGSKFRHLHPRFRGPDPETTSRPTEKRSASQRSAVLAWIAASSSSWMRPFDAAT